jgi:hypothetical protein
MMTEGRNARITKIRPISWKICVLGREAAERVRQLLHENGVTTTQLAEEPGLSDPPLFSFIAALEVDAPMTEVELESLLRQHDQIELSFTDD